MANPWAKNGGSRPGAGRKLGAATAKTREVANQAMSDGGVTPLEVMVQTMRALWAQATVDPKKPDLDKAKEACEVAQAAAPYMHPRLASVEQFVDAKVRQFAVSSEELTADEWDRTYGPLATAGRPAESSH